MSSTTSYWVRVSNGCGSDDSNTATITVNQGPSISAQPQAKTICEGNTATLSVSASGTTPLSYQWYQGTAGNTSTPVGTNSNSFTTPSLTSTTNYWVRVSNSCGSVDSATATISLNQGPTISTQPHGPTVCEGETLTLNVTATGTAPLHYQWYQGNAGDTSTPVGSDNNAYLTPPLATTTAYWVRVTNSCGSADSTAATITVDPLPGDFSLYSPNNGATLDDGTTTVNLRWGVSSNAVSYDLMFGATSPPPLLANIGGTSYDVSVSAGNVYYWSVTALNECGATETKSGIRQFSVGDCAPPQIIVSPQSQDICTGTTASLSVSATGSAPLHYQWYEGSPGDTSTPVGTDASTYVTPALSETTRYWVRVSNECGDADSQTAVLTVRPKPGAFSLVSPPEGANLPQETISVDLQWNPAANVNHYEVYFGSGANPPLHSTVTGTTVSVDVTAGQTYNWKIVARNDCGVSAAPASGFWSLAVQSEGAPMIELSPATISVETVAGQNPVAGSFAIRNSGEGVLNYSVADNATWLWCDPTIGDSAGESDTVQVHFDCDDLESGFYTGYITVSDNAAANNPQVVTVNLTVLEAPAFIELSTDALPVDGVIGENAPYQFFTVRNGGSGNLAYTIGVDVGWLGCDPSQGISTGEADRITVYFDTAAMAAGDYQGSITVQDSAGLAEAKTIQVDLHIGESGPQIAVSTDSIFASCLEGHDAVNQSFLVWNSGGGELEFTVGDNVGWLSCSPVSGSSQGETVIITLQYDSANLSLGTYHGTIQVAAVSAAGQVVNIPVRLQVTDEEIPQIYCSPAFFNLDCEQGENVLSQTFIVQNSGSGRLQYQISTDVGWMWCDPSSATSTGEADTITITFETHTLAPGMHDGTIEIRDDDAANSPQYLDVRVWIRGDQPHITPAPDHLQVVSPEGADAEARTFTIRNLGRNILSYTIHDDVAWMECSPQGGATTLETDVITVTFSTGQLAAGTYQGTITISDSNADNSPCEVPVTLTVIGEPVRVWFKENQQGSVFRQSASQLLPATYLTFELGPESFPGASPGNPAIIQISLPTGARLSQTLATGATDTSAPLPQLGERIVDLAVCTYDRATKTLVHASRDYRKDLVDISPHAVQLFRYVAGEKAILLRINESTADWVAPDEGTFYGVTIGLGHGLWPDSGASNWGAAGVNRQEPSLFFLDLRNYAFNYYTNGFPVQFDSYYQRSGLSTGMWFEPSTVNLFTLASFEEDVSAINSQIGGHIADYAVVDLDRDGYEDIVSVSDDEARLYWCFGQPDGSFDGLEWRETTGISPVAVDAADVSGDARPDILVGDASGTLHVYFWEELFSEEALFSKVARPAVSVKLAGRPTDSMLLDLNEDAAFDYVYIDQDHDELHVLFGNAFMPDEMVTLTTGSMPVALTQGDFDGDDLADMAVANFGDSTVTIFWNAGDGTFTAQEITDIGHHPVDITATDFNQDGRGDLAVAAEGDKSLAALLSEEGDTFRKDRLYFTKSPSALHADNFDGLRGPDILVGFSDGKDIPFCTYNEFGNLAFDYELRVIRDVLVSPSGQVSLSPDNILSVAGGTGFGGISSRQGVSGIADYGYNVVHFPRSSEISFSVVNLANEEGLINLELYDNGGRCIQTSSSPVPARTQFVRYFSSVLGVEADEADRWVRGFTTQAETYGFWLVNNGSLEYLDGSRIPDVRDASVDFVFPEIAVDGTQATQLVLINPLEEQALAQVRLLAENGSLKTFRTILLKGRSRTVLDVATFFPGVSPTDSIRVKSDRGIIGIEIFGTDEAASCLEGLPMPRFGDTLYSPHFAVGALGAEYESVLTLVNGGEVDEEVTVQLIGDDGTPLTGVENLHLPAGGKVIADLADLFQLTSSLSGYLVVETSVNAQLVGSLQFGDAAAGEFVTCVPLQRTGAPSYILGHIANGELYGFQFMTGVAILNPEEVSRVVVVSAYNEQGMRLDSKPLTIESHHRRVFLLNQEFPELAAIFGGYILLESVDDARFMAMELFLGNPAGESLQFLSAVPAVPLR
ncbi:MAG: VCBS repeat-containing protein [Acidobacteria bacterium]|nr:VCBS repeat-containing protein [Acidobacteriota bacterium]